MRQHTDKCKIQGIITYTLINEDGSIAKKGTVENRNILLRVLVPFNTTLYKKFARIEVRTVDDKAKYVLTNNNYINKEGTGTTIQCEVTDATDAFIEHTYRFQSDGNNHDIYGFSFDSQYNYAVVDPKFVQSGSQVLEIKYRMLYTFSQNPADLPYVYALKCALKYYKFIDLGTYMYLPAAIGNSDDKQIITHGATNISAYGNSIYNANADSTDTLTSNHQYDKLKYINIVLNGFIEKETQMYRDYIGTNNKHTTYPFGAFYNHSKDSLYWCEDISNLATGKGYPTINSNGSESYVSGTKKELLSFRIAKSGNVGVSTYNSVQYPVLNRRVYDRVIGSYHSSTITGISFHGRKDIVCNLKYPAYTEVNPQVDSLDNWAVFDLTRYMRASKSCLMVVDPLSNELWRYDTNDGLPVTTSSDYNDDIHSNATGDIFINTGTSIVKVVNLTNTNITSHSTITLTDIGASGSSIELLRIGKGNYMVVKAGGLYESNDAGATWSEITGITWGTKVPGLSSLNDFVISPYNNDEFFFRNNATNYCWYDNSTKICTDFDTINNYTEIACDPVHGLWYATVGNNYHHAIAILKFNTNTYIVNNITNNLDYVSTGFSSEDYRKCLPMYDSLGNLCLIGKDFINSDGTKAITCTSLADNSRLYVDDVHHNFNTYTRSQGQRLRKVDPNNIDRTNLAIFNKDNDLFMPFNCYGSNADKCSDAPDSVFKFMDNRPILAYELLGLQIKKWDASTSSWTDDNQPALADATVGAVKGNAIRKNFSINESTFNGRCYLDISGGLGSVDFTTGITILGQFNPTVKSDNPNHTGPNANAVKPEEQTIAWMSIHNKATKKGFALLYKNKDNNMVIEDYTGATTSVNVIASTPPAADVRVAMVLNSTADTVQIYVDNVLEGTVSLGASMNVDNTSNDLSVLIGASQWHMDAGVVHYGRLFKGSITNIQVFNKFFTAALVDEDFTSNPHIVADTANLQSKWDMTVTDYNESRPTHSTAEPAINGSLIAFPEGDLSGDSYVKDDSYSVPVLEKGFLKGNSETLTFKVCNAWNKKQLTNMYDADGLTTIPSTAKVVTDFVPTISGNYNAANTVYYNNFYSAKETVARFIGLDDGSDLSFTFTPTFPINTGTSSGYYFYSTFKYNSKHYGIRWLTDEASDVEWVVDGVYTAIPGVIAKSGDKFKLLMSGTNLELFIDADDGNGFVSKGTTVIPDPNTYYRTIRLGKWASGDYSTCYMINIRITGKVLAGTMFYGDPTNKTGLFDEKIGNFTHLWEDKPIISNGAIISDKQIDTGKFVNDTAYLPNVGGLTQSNQGVTVFDSTLYGETVTLDDWHYEQL